MGKRKSMCLKNDISSKYQDLQSINRQSQKYFFRRLSILTWVKLIAAASPDVCIVLNN